MSLWDKFFLSLGLAGIVIFSFFIFQQIKAQEFRMHSAPCSGFIYDEIRYLPARCLKELSK